MQFTVKAAASLTLIFYTTGVSADDRSPIFKDLSESERVRVEPVLSDSYFKSGLPRLYLRHRLVRIDTEQLKLLLDADWRSNEEGETSQGVSLDLFDDLSIRVAVDQKIRNGFHGATAFFGRQKSDRPGTANFNSYFHDSGRFKAVVHTEDASYLIENVLDYQYFVILAQSPLDHAID